MRVSKLNYIIFLIFIICKRFIWDSFYCVYAVFNELDDLKKRSENTRNVIRWLEQEFKHGNRHMRAQRDNENLAFSLIKIPRKLGK